jgi:hypothetical protein
MGVEARAVYGNINWLESSFEGRCMYTVVYFSASDLYLDHPQRQLARPNSQTGKRDVDMQLSNNDITPVSSLSHQLGTTSWRAWAIHLFNIG